MKLSIIIVNYNVRYFLEQCLYSVSKAVKGMQAEVFVVDNNSVDGSVEMVKEKFPGFTCIDNKENLGFSKANNQAIRLSKGEYVLLLNPDTLIEEDTLRKVCEFMDSHPDAGGLGVKMVDGNGNFLPESKRGLPTPAVAFYKIFGFSRIFPKSKVFGKYHLGFLDKEETHEIEILSGAFMLMRKSVLDKTGLLDETFFMYGEDIDLSYRIIKAGYKNYYFPGTRIIHYKGESTKKSSVNYVLVFYNAMVIFAKKHFSQKNARLFSFLINIAIYFRAVLAIVSRFFSRAAQPIADALLLFAGIMGIKYYWEHNIVFPGGGEYPYEIVWVAIPLYILTWLMSVYISGGYDKPVRLSKISQGLFIGSVIILIFYALLPEDYRFSRALIVFGAIWGFISMMGFRVVLHLFKIKAYRLGSDSNRRFAIVGNTGEVGRVADLIRKTNAQPGFIGLIAMDEKQNDKEGFIGNVRQLADIINIYKIDEVIFCAKDMSSQMIIDKMSELNTSQVELKIAPPESLSIIGSQSITTSGDVFIIELDSISNANNKRSKRFLDFTTSLLFLGLFPLELFFVKNPFRFLANIFKVLFAKKSWVGFKITKESDKHKLPKIKPGILYPTDVLKNQDIANDTVQRLNLLYARDYKIMNDLNIIFTGFRELGR
ncbi:MAG: glycosyltransferase [Chlorobi bacterium]|nr:glycosyltransferase [Chlorobiota bacterium]